MINASPPGNPGGKYIPPVKKVDFTGVTKCRHYTLEFRLDGTKINGGK